MPTEWIEYEGKRILCTTYARQSPEEMIDTIEEQAKILRASPDPVLLLDDFTESYASKKFMNRAKVLGRELRSKVERNALLGVTGAKKVLVSAYVMFTGVELQACVSKREALEYLTR